MTEDPRAALNTLTAAFERHLAVATDRRDPEDQAVMTAAEDLADAFLDYDEALFDATGVTTPLDGPYDDDDLDDDDDEDDDDDDLDEDDLADDEIEGDVIEDEVPPPGAPGSPTSSSPFSR